MNLTVAGTGDPVLFIHGCPTSPDVLAPIAGAVAQTHRAIQVALPGYGASPALPPPWTIADVDAALEAAVAPLVGGAPLAIVGFSGGVYHALALASRAVLRVDRLVSLAGLMTLTPEERDGFRGFARALREGVDLRDAVRDRFLSPAFLASHPDALGSVTAWLDPTSPTNLADEFEAFAAAPDLDAAVRALDVPITVRVGSLDLATPPAKSEAIAKAAKRGTLELVPGVGHALMYEDLEGTTASVLRALAR